MNAGDALVCSFCGKTRNATLKFIAGPDATYICSECVALCNEIIDDEGGGVTGADPSPALGRLDASWRGEYITRATAEQDADVAAGMNVTDEARCVFCRIFNSSRTGTSDESNLIVHRGVDAVVILNAYPYTSGHLMVMPTRHVGSLSELTDAEHTEVWELVRHATGAITRAYNPGGMNVGANVGSAAGAGIPGHLHVHALPRWDGDTNFMTAIAETRVVPEALATTWSKLRAAW